MWNKVPKNEYHKGKPGKKQNPFKKDLIAYDQKSMMGYRDDSPYRQLPVIDINTPNGYIDMSATGIPLFANGQYLPPYSGQHFMGTDVVREIPINNWDNPSLDVHLVHPHYKPLPQGKDMDPGFSPKSFPSQKPTGYYNPQHPEYFQKGGWLDAYQQGGDPSIPELNQAKKGGSKGHNKKTGLKVNREFTSKNIQSSINDLMLRNETLYGPAGKKRYKPDLKYQQGGWLDAYQSGGTPIHYTSEAEYQKGLLNKNKSAQQLAAEREWAGKKVAKAEAAKKAATPPPAYSWSGSDMMSQATPVQPQVAMTYSDAPHHDIVTESKTIKAKNEAIKAKNEEDYKTQTDLYGPVLGAIRYYANKADDYSEGTGPTYYYKDPNTNQATAFKGASAYEQFGKYMPDVAYSAFPLGEIVEPIISPVGRYLKSAFTFAPELSGAVDEAAADYGRQLSNVPSKLPGSANITEDVNLIHNPTRSEQLNAHAFDIYKGDTRVGEISGNRLPNGDFQTTDIKVHPEYQRQGIGTQAYTQLNASLNPGNKVTSWGAFVENPEGIKPGMNTWESMVNKGLARRTPQGGYEMIPLNTPTELPGSPNIVKSDLGNPLGIVDRLIPRPPTPFQLLGVEDSWNNWSPLNYVPGYGKKLIDKTSAYPNMVGFRKFGNSLSDVIESQSLRPKGGLRMGASQISTEGNWAEPGKTNEMYPGIFEATMDPRVPGSNIKLEKWPNRNGIVGTTKEGNVAIPLNDPGLSFNRRLPFSSRYVPIDKEKLINNTFQLATQLPHFQSLVEKYGIYAGLALLSGYMYGGKEQALKNLKTVNKYSVDPIMNWTKEQWDALGVPRDYHGNQLKKANTIQQKKLGGISRKSAEKVVNYNQNPNFVKTQNSNWLDKYK